MTQQPEHAFNVSLAATTCMRHAAPVNETNTLDEPSDGEGIIILVRRSQLRLMRRARDLTEPPQPGIPPAKQPAPPQARPPEPAPPPNPAFPLQPAVWTPAKKVGSTHGKLPVLPPETRGDCLPGGRNEARPCLFASCRYSLLVDVECESARVRETAEDPETLPHSCALDVADTVDDTGATVILRDLEPYFGVTRELIRQLELRAMASFSRGLTRKLGDEKMAKVTRSPWGTKKGLAEMLRRAGRAE